MFLNNYVAVFAYACTSYQCGYRCNLLVFLVLKTRWKEDDVMEKVIDQYIVYM